MKFVASILFALAAHITWVAKFFASDDLDVLALEMDSEETDAEATLLAEREEYEARAMRARIAISESTRSDVSRAKEGPLEDVWFDWMEPSTIREAAELHQ